MKRRSQQESILRPCSSLNGYFLAKFDKRSGHYARNHNHFYHQSCEAPVGWLRAISDGAHLIQLDWNQIGWKTQIVQMMFHVKQSIN